MYYLINVYTLYLVKAILQRLNCTQVESTKIKGSVTCRQSVLFYFLLTKPRYRKFRKFCLLPWMFSVLQVPCVRPLWLLLPLRHWELQAAQRVRLPRWRFRRGALVLQRHLYGSSSSISSHLLALIYPCVIPYLRTGWIFRLPAALLQLDFWHHQFNETLQPTFHHPLPDHQCPWLQMLLRGLTTAVCSIRSFSATAFRHIGSNVWLSQRFRIC